MYIYEGSGVAMITPFIEETGEIDWKAFDNLIEFHITNNTDAIIVTGTTGESATMADDEHIQVVARAVRQVDGRVPVIAGTGINDTAHTIRLSQFSENVGADALLIVTPYYNKTTPAGMMAHYGAVAESVELPIILYHVPGRTAVDFPVDQVVELAKRHNNIVAMKDATGDMEWSRELFEKRPEGFAVYSGNDDLTLELLRLGGQGSISVNANVMPQEAHDLCRLHREGDDAGAQAVHDKILSYTQNMFIEVNPVPVKYIAHTLGLCDNAYRLPLIEPSQETKDTLDADFHLVEKYSQK